MTRTSSRLHLVPGWAAALLLAGCATAVPDTTPGSASAPVPPRWHAPLPEDVHDADTAGSRRWWARFDDPMLMRLIAASAEASATLAQASARMADARAARTAGAGALLPVLEAHASATRDVQAPGMPVGTTASVGLQASWELDLFGANRAGVDAARARLESSRAGWHAARVSLAAEVASAYVDLRACEARSVEAELDAGSRARTAQLTALAADTGFDAPAAAELALASAAQGNAVLVQQRAQCDRAIKSLVALTAIEEGALRGELAMSTAQLPQPAALQLDAVPALALAQRPDIAAAAQELIAASADADQARALRWPRVSLAGSIGAARQRGEGVGADGSVWSIGPVAVTFPLFDAGVRRANAAAAAVRYASARTTYAARLRTAVQEVETALVALHSAGRRGEDARTAVAGFERSHRAAEARWRGGFASLLELEDTRRSVVAARSALVEQRRESALAWIDLYRATGGGWWPSSPTADEPPQ